MSKAWELVYYFILAGLLVILFVFCVIGAMHAFLTAYPFMVSFAVALGALILIMLVIYLCFAWVDIINKSI